jgi:hypothetical protein
MKNGYDADSKTAPISYFYYSAPVDGQFRPETTLYAPNWKPIFRYTSTDLSRDIKKTARLGGKPSIIRSTVDDDNESGFAEAKYGDFSKRWIENIVKYRVNDLR